MQGQLPGLITHRYLTIRYRKNLIASVEFDLATDPVQIEDATMNNSFFLPRLDRNQAPTLPECLLQQRVRVELLDWRGDWWYPLT